MLYFDLKYLSFVPGVCVCVCVGGGGGGGGSKLQQ